MGGIGKLFGGLLGGKAPTVKAPKPLPAPKPVDTAPIEDVTEQDTKAKQLRAALYATGGGAAGEEILGGGVSKRQTLLGN